MKRLSRWLGLAVAVGASLVTEQAALGHPGHDHSDPISAGLLHALLGFGPVLAAVAGGVLAYALVRVARRRSSARRSPD